MSKIQYPLILSSCDIRPGETTFFLPRREVSITAPGALFRRLVRLCDGVRSHDSIVEALAQRWDKDSVDALLAKLTEEGVFVDSRNVQSFVWQFVGNPTAWSDEHTTDELEAYMLEPQLSRATTLHAAPHTPVTSALATRQSTRQFGGGAVGTAQVVRMLWAGYGLAEGVVQLKSGALSRHTVPSGGAMYPTRLYLVVFHGSRGLQRGIYCVESRSDCSVGLHRVRGSAEKARACFVSEDTVRNAAGVVVICSDVARTAWKYGSRALLYAALEAGHVAQNVLMSAQADGVATVEIGGFLEGNFRKLLQLDPGVETMTTIVFGTPQGVALPHDVVEDDIIRGFKTSERTLDCGYRLPFVMTFAHVNVATFGDPWWTCGRASTAHMAQLKARAEAVEWFACTRAGQQSLVVASMQELGEAAVDPRTCVRYRPSQYRGQTDVVPFDPTLPYEWQEARDVVGDRPSFVLGDLVYFPFLQMNCRRFAHGNSSGTAAHTERNAAVENALFELAEREAFMVTWLHRACRPTIARTSLPVSVERRVRAVERQGFTLAFVDLTLDLSPVVMVAVSGNDGAYFTCAASSGPTHLYALQKALMEAEASVYGRLKHGPSTKRIAVRDVRFPEDHALLYEEHRHVKRAMFLMGDGNPVALQELERGRHLSSRNDFLERFAAEGRAVHVVDLVAKDPLLSQQPFSVVKVVVPGLVPLHFGWGLEASGLERVGSLAVRFGLAEGRWALNHFPHPYN